MVSHILRKLIHTLVFIAGFSDDIVVAIIAIILWPLTIFKIIPGGKFKKSKKIHLG